ncbi:MAG: hypothetical protein AAFZ38_06295 [Myxococcota bacterium]
MKTKSVVLVALGLGLMSCGGPALTTRGALVKITDAKALHIDCKPIRDVTARGNSPEAAQVLLRNEAGTMAADRLVIQDQAEVPNGFVIKAQAYGCPTGT